MAARPATAASWLAALGFVAALVCLAPAATAVDRYWTDGSGQWDISGHWTPSGQPQEGDSVYLTQSDATDRTVTYCNTTNPSAALYGLWIDATGLGTMTLDMPNNHALSGGDEHVGCDGRGAVTQSDGANEAFALCLGYNAAGEGTYALTGGTLSSLSLIIGCQGTGTLHIDGGGQVSTWSGALGYGSGSTGTATVTGAGSTWINSYDLQVGGEGAGTLTVADGGLVSTGTLYASLSDLFGNGTITAHGAVLDADLVFDSAHGLTQALAFGSGGTLNLNVDGTGDLGAGHKGTGTLRIADGRTVASANGFLGYWPGSTGTATVTGEGSTWTSSTLYVGCQGTGTLHIEAGGQVSSSWSVLGSESGSTGTVTVTGAGSTWTNSSDLFVGFGGAGTLSIRNGGQVFNTDGDVGGSDATVTVDGIGSRWTNSGTLTVGLGDSGTGTLNIQNGGQVSNTNAALGGWYGSVGTVTVDGGGSKWANSRGLIVGYCGTGTLNIKNGGQVSSSDGELGSDSGANGTVTVDGIGSIWSNTGSLYVGGTEPWAGGTGSVTVRSGGQLAVGGILKLWKADSAVAVNSGTLTAGALEGSTGTIGITDPAGGTALTVGSAASAAFFGDLSDSPGGSGSLRKVGDGTQTLGGAGIAYTGATTVLEGLLKLSDTTAFASDILNSATTEFQVTAGTWTFDEALGGAGTFVKSGEGTLVIAGLQDYDPGAVFDVLGGALVLNTDAGSEGADLSISVTDAELYFGTDQHLDTLAIGDDGKVIFAGAQVVVLEHLVIGGTDLGATALTPEPATLALLALGAAGVLLRRRRRA